MNCFVQTVKRRIVLVVVVVVVAAVLFAIDRHVSKLNKDCVEAGGVLIRGGRTGYECIEVRHISPTR
jgi:hypothetical protein